MSKPYAQPGLIIGAGNPVGAAIVRALQRDLRALGYLRSGITGAWTKGTEAAVRALQFDLLHNNGHGTDGNAPVAIQSFNSKPGGGTYVNGITGVVDGGTAAALASLANDSRIVQLPESLNPAADNARALNEILASHSKVAPAPFIIAIAQQESSDQHFHVPRTGDEDGFVTIGLDRNDPASSDHITSRGYGLAQYTFFHHPLTPQEVADFVADPVRNARNAYVELRDKIDHFVAGPHFATDRTVEHPRLPLRLCRYPNSDVRYMSDCSNCAHAVRKVEIVRGTPVYQGSAISYQPTQYYPSAIYTNVPDRAEFLCDWPYAVRRYNGDGVNSYHYQTKILLNLLR
jgi:hypothetical protein